MSEDRELFSDRMLEGEYTTWNWLWTRDYGAAAELGCLMCDNHGTTYFTDKTTNNSYVITRANVQTITPLTNWFLNYNNVTGVVPWGTTPWSASVTAKYVLSWNLGAPQRISVWRYGARIYDIVYSAITLDADMVRGIAMSADGHYIAAILRSFAGLKARYVHLYEGR